MLVDVQLLLSFINVIIRDPIRYVSVGRFDTKNWCFIKIAADEHAPAPAQPAPCHAIFGHIHPIVQLDFNTTKLYSRKSDIVC